MAGREATMPTISSPPYLIHALLEPRPNFEHPLDPAAQRQQLSLGLRTGLTRTGVHLCRLEPQTESTILHWHTADDEWLYIISCGPNASIIVHETSDEGKDEVKEVPLQTGDFLGFPAGMRTARKLCSGDVDMQYLVGGSREPVDVVHYPTLGKRLVLDRTGSGSSWWVDTANAQDRKKTVFDSTLDSLK